MEIILAPEHAYHFVPQFTIDIARDRIDQKKVNLVAGTVGALLSRPKPDEIQMLSVEHRLETFWHIAVTARTVFDRSRSYTVNVSGPEVKRVSVLGQEAIVDPQARGGPAFSLTGTEHCLEEHRVSRAFDGMTGEPADLSRYLTFSKTEIADLAAFQPEGTLVVPPQVRATAVVRQVMAEVVKPVQQAQVIHEERVEVENIELNFRPVYAFEYEWAAKSKRAVIEFDALTGDIRAGGKKWADQFKGMISRDLIFDVTADAVGMIVPGGSIAVKLVKAVVDRGK
ncbi:MAG: hypothetical protein ACT4QE_23580 [Anaerolineales bacterium]